MASHVAGGEPPGRDNTTASMKGEAKHVPGTKPRSTESSGGSKQKAFTTPDGGRTGKQQPRKKQTQPRAPATTATLPGTEARRIGNDSSTPGITHLPAPPSPQARQPTTTSTGTRTKHQNPAEKLSHSNRSSSHTRIQGTKPATTTPTGNHKTLTREECTPHNNQSQTHEGNTPLQTTLPPPRGTPSSRSECPCQSRLPRPSRGKRG